MSGDDRITTISELRHGYKNVNCIFIVIETGTKQQTKDGSLVRKCRVADRTGSIMFSIWNEEAEAVNTGDIIKLTRGYSSVWKGCLVLYCGKYGIVEKLGEFTMVFSETPDMSLRTETVSPRSNSPPPSQSRQQQHSSSGESSNTDVSSSHNEGRAQSGPPISSRHDNHISNSYSSNSQQYEFQDGRHHKSGSGHHHHSNTHHSHDDNGRFYSNTPEENRSYNDRRSHHMQSYDNYIPSAGNSRHHPYQRHNGWR